MTACLDRQAVENRLVTMVKSVGQLGAPGPLDRGRLARDPASGLVVERVLALLADLAFEVNRQVAAAVLGETPEERAVRRGVRLPGVRAPGNQLDCGARPGGPMRTAWHADLSGLALGTLKVVGG